MTNIPVTDLLTKIVVTAYNQIPNERFEEAKGKNSFFFTCLNADELNEDKVAVYFNLFSLEEPDVLLEYFSTETIINVMADAVERYVTNETKVPPIFVYYQADNESAFTGCIELTDEDDENIASIQDVLKDGESNANYLGTDDPNWEVN